MSDTQTILPLPPVIDAGPETFDTLVLAPRDELVVVYFWGMDCPNCEVFAAHLPRLLEALRGASMRLVKVDAYTHDDLARRFGLFGIPSFRLFKDGRMIGRMSEFRGRDFWLSVIRDHLPARPDATPP